jgi:surface polysaccharide O-acyltransferase-like enzyme
MYVTGYHIFNGVKIEASNGALIVQLTAFVLFVGSLKLKFSARAERCIGFLGCLTMGIYIMHPFVLAALNKFIPTFTQGSGAMNLLFWIATTVICGIGTLILQKIPLLNRLLKL